MLGVLDARVRNRQVGQISFADDCGGAGFNGVWDEGVPVGGAPGARDEYAARLNVMAGFNNGRANLDREVAAR